MISNIASKLHSLFFLYLLCLTQQSLASQPPVKPSLAVKMESNSYNVLHHSSCGMCDLHYSYLFRLIFSGLVGNCEAPRQGWWFTCVCIIPQHLWRKTEGGVYKVSSLVTGWATWAKMKMTLDWAGSGGSLKPSLEKRTVAGERWGVYLVPAWEAAGLAPGSSRADFGSWTKAGQTVASLSLWFAFEF